jgi:hypothetical protein
VTAALFSSPPAVLGSWVSISASSPNSSPFRPGLLPACVFDLNPNVGSTVLIKEKRAQEAAAVAYANHGRGGGASRLQSKDVLEAVAHRLASHNGALAGKILADVIAGILRAPIKKLVTNMLDQDWRSIRALERNTSGCVRMGRTTTGLRLQCRSSFYLS